MVKLKHIRLVGIPVSDGARHRGCEMGPDAYRAAGLAELLGGLGHKVADTGNLTPAAAPKIRHSNKNLHNLPQVYGWISAIEKAAYEQMGKGFPLFMGGDHIMAAGIGAGLARYAAKVKKPLFVLWLDTHSDFHSPDTTETGHLHGTPVAYFSGQKGFAGVFPPLKHAVAEENICMMGLRSVDAAERKALSKSKVEAYDMRMIDEFGFAALLAPFLQRVKAAGGLLHVSLDVDFLDPSFAPAVGTAVVGGATYREAHMIMEILHDSGLPTSLELSELNPMLDERARTANVMSALAASLLGQNVIDYRGQKLHKG